MEPDAADPEDVRGTLQRHPDGLPVAVSGSGLASGLAVGWAALTGVMAAWMSPLVCGVGVGACISPWSIPAAAAVGAPVVIFAHAALGVAMVLQALITAFSPGWFKGSTAGKVRGLLMAQAAPLMVGWLGAGLLWWATGAALLGSVGALGYMWLTSTNNASPAVWLTLGGVLLLAVPALALLGCAVAALGQGLAVVFATWTARAFTPDPTPPDPPPQLRRKRGRRHAPEQPAAE